MNPAPIPAPLSTRLTNLAGASVGFTAMTVGTHIAMNGVGNAQAVNAIHTVAVAGAFWFVTAVWWLTAVCWTVEYLSQPQQTTAPARPPAATRSHKLIDDYRLGHRGRYTQQPHQPNHDTTQAAA